MRNQKEKIGDMNGQRRFRGKKIVGFKITKTSTIKIINYKGVGIEGRTPVSPQMIGLQNIANSMDDIRLIRGFM